jgi:zinc-ribbon family
MLIIFGMRNRVHQHGPCVAASCPRCHNEVVLIYAVITRWFTLFFIPVIPIKRTRTLVCPVCSWRREVPKNSEHLALEMIGITESWKAHQLADDEYARRVDAFWSFMSGDGADTTPGAPTGPSATPPAPPARPDQPPAPPSAG